MNEPLQYTKQNEISGELLETIKNKEGGETYPRKYAGEDRRLSERAVPRGGQRQKHPLVERRGLVDGLAERFVEVVVQAAVLLDIAPACLLSGTETDRQGRGRGRGKGDTHRQDGDLVVSTSEAKKKPFRQQRQPLG